jgi:hypothetical protein
MRRFNSDGIERGELLIALRTVSVVRAAVARGSCLLCRKNSVNAAGLCEGCAANLSDIEQEAARPWLEGRLR